MPTYQLGCFGEVQESFKVNTVICHVSSCLTRAHLLILQLQLVNEEIDHQLHQARAENDKLSNLMGKMGINPRPTVAQWLQQKREQKKAAMQEALISWDR